jgi:8-oxo-dGTP pyrophosphatase MutT (NUDIX family)
MSESPPERPTARVLLLDRADRILLMRGRLPGAQAADSFWFTVGGGMEPGETLAEAVAREIHEETGIRDFELGPVVWVREGVLAMPEPMLFKERYVVARCDAAELSRDGWQALERELVDDIRWWTLAELLMATERVYPPGIETLLPDVLAGRFPAEPVPIPWDWPST